MLNVLHIISDLRCTDTAKQLALLVPVLPRDKFRVEVAVLGSADGPLAASLRQASIPIHTIHHRFALDVAGMRNLRRVADKLLPAIVHTWDASSLVASQVIGLPFDGDKPWHVVSGTSDREISWKGWLAKRLVKRVARVLVASRADGDRCRHRGVPPAALTIESPAVAPAPAAADHLAFRTAINVPLDARLILAGDKFDTTAGLKHAIWAFDMIRYESPDLHLVVIGDGPARGSLEGLSRSLGRGDDRVRFAGERADRAALMGQASLVWITSQGGGGAPLALEAMAAARPVVGFATPDLSEVVSDGETGYLVPPGDRVQFAAKTRTLLDDAALTAKLGEAGRLRTVEHFSVARAVDQLARVYREVAGI